MQFLACLRLAEHHIGSAHARHRSRAAIAHAGSALARGAGDAAGADRASRGAPRESLVRNGATRIVVAGESCPQL
eukprot:11289143-Alexandrium_andersonii.AAC.1